MARRLILVAAAALVAGGIAFAVFLLVHDDAKALTRAEYIARANAQCRVYNARLARIDAPVAVGNPQAVAAPIEQALPLVVEPAAAYALCSVCVDLHLSEVVDVPYPLVSALLPLDVLEAAR